MIVRCRDRSPLGRTRSTAGVAAGCELVVPELSGQVVGPRPILAVLLERDPDFLLLHGETRLRGGRYRRRIARRGPFRANGLARMQRTSARRPCAAGKCGRLTQDLTARLGFDVWKIPSALRGEVVVEA